MENSHKQSDASAFQSGLAFIIGVICTAIAAIGMFWLSKIIPGIYFTLKQNGLTFYVKIPSFSIFFGQYFF